MTAPASADSVRRARGYLGEVFVVETRPADGPVRDDAVLILPPLGYEETASYRPLRVLADELARAGHLVVRLDWPGLGDSAGDPLDPDLGHRALRAIRALTDALRDRGLSRVVGLGVRAGGLLALAAGGFDAMALWGTPPSGKRYLREERAFQRLAAKASGPPPPDAPSLPEGAREAGGFVYGPGMVEALMAIDAAAALSASPPGRLLLLPREGTQPAAALVAAAESADIGLSIDPAGGLGDLLDDPYKARRAPAVRDALRDWLGPPRATLHPAASRRVGALLLAGGVRERPWVEPGGAGLLSGVLCEPSGGAQPGATWTVFFNAGGVRRSGPNRLWTRAARALAAQGRPSLRVDVRDVGDADGTDEPWTDLEQMYAQSAIDDAVQAAEFALQAGAGALDVVGLCSGAFLGAQAAARVSVRRAVLVNGLAFVWDDEARAKGMTAHIRGSLLDARRWRRLLTGRIDAGALGRAILEDGRQRARALALRARGEPPPSPVDQLLATLRRRGTDLQLVCSEGDPSLPYLHRHVPPDRRPAVTSIPSADHTLRPLHAQERLLQVILAAGT